MVFSIFKIVHRLLGVKWLPILIILVIAALLRFNNITQPFTDVFSWRQTSTAMMAQNYFQTNWNIFYPEVNWSGPGPSYQGREFQTVSYISALLYTVFGQHDWIGRAVAILFGLWGIFALYQLVRRIWDEQHALAAAIMMSILPGAVFTDRSFLPDPAMVSLVTTSVWMLIVYLQTDKTRYLILSAIIGCLGFLTKIPGMLSGIPMIYATFAILSYRKALNTKRLTIMISTGILALIPVVLYYLWARYLSHTYPPYHFAGSGNWLWDKGLLYFIKNAYFLPNFWNVAIYWMWGVSGVVLVFFGLLYGPPSTASREVKIKGLDSTVVNAPWLFHWWLAGCIFYYFIGSMELVHNPWNFHIFDPVFAALAARALIILSTLTTGTITTISQTVIVRIAIISIFVCFSGYNTLKILYNPHYALKSYYMGLELKKISQPQDLVVTIAEDIGDPVPIYYSQRRGWVFPPADQWAPQELAKEDSTSIRQLEILRSKGADWFGMVIQHHQDIEQNHPQFASYLKDTYPIQIATESFIIYRLIKPETTVSIGLLQQDKPLQEKIKK